MSHYINNNYLAAAQLRTLFLNATRIPFPFSYQYLEPRDKDLNCYIRQGSEKPALVESAPANGRGLA